MRQAHSIGRLVLIAALSAGGLPTFGSSARAQAAPAVPVDQAYRHRVLGVFDELSGEAISDAEVTDVLAGLTAKTSTSGAVSLAFLPDGGGMIRVRKFGYMLQRSAHCGKGSAPDIYVDGVPITHPAPGAPIDLSEFQTETLAGIEYYATASLAPAEFSGTSLACGVLVLWTRER